MKNEVRIKNDKAMAKWGITAGMTISCPANGMSGKVESVKWDNATDSYKVKVEEQPECLLLQLAELFENGTLVVGD